MAGVTEEYKKEKLLNWKPTWDPDKINSWSGQQLEKIYRRIQQEIVMGIEEKLDYRLIKK
ncbi:MAG: hypothetical protein K0R18_92 [Bacillales bacterium]|jgi:hypothetical protein|nr:hypothetical protein [Bacillales bacterium]